jgi:branched-chain amino acid aminotransferase
MILLNGHFYHPDDPEVRLYNRSFKYGDGLFESIRVWEGTPLFWEAHLERLFEGMKALKYEFDKKEFTVKLAHAWAKLLAEKETIIHGKLRIHVFRSGDGTFLPLDRTPQFLVEASPMLKDYFESPRSISLTAFHEVELFYSAFSPFKTANSLPYILGAIFAKDNGFDDSIMFCDGFVSETTSANLFVVADNGEISTPPLHHGCLPGIMRQQIIRLCSSNGLSISEKALKEKDLEEAREIFVTNSISGISTVSAFRELKKTEAAGKDLQSKFIEYLKIHLH